MKVLILVQSFEGDSTFYAKGDLSYEHLQKAQEETWDSVSNPNTKTIYYFPSLTKSGLEGNKLYIQHNLEYHYMFIHFMKALVQCMKYEWDYVFKTDNSSYVNKDELVRVLQSKPKTSYYGGHPYDGPNINDIKDFMWGEGVALSRDVAQKLIDIYAMDPNIRFGPEDLIMGLLLKDRFEWDPSLKILVYWNIEKDPFPIGHVYRCRNDQSVETIFSDDIKAMKDIHQRLT